MTDKVRWLPATTTFTVEQALKSAVDLGLKSVVIIGWDADGEFALRSSRTSREDANWLMDVAKDYIRMKP